MYNNDMVSVIIPAYNSEKWIVQAIKSVLEQTYNLTEIIIIDDGSIDNTKKVLKKYIDDNLIKYFYQKNSGASIARNKGIEKSIGRYIAFLDADDYWAKDKLKKQIFEMSKDKSAICIGNTLVVNESNKSLFKIENSFSKSKEIMMKNIYLSKVISITPSIIVDKNIISEKLTFNTALTHREDSLYVLTIINKYKFCYLNEILFYRREHDNSLRNSLNFKTTILNSFKFMKIAEKEIPMLTMFHNELKAETLLNAAKQTLALKNFEKSKKLSILSFKLLPNNKALLLYLASLLKLDFELLKKIYRKFKK